MEELVFRTGVCERAGCSSGGDACLIRHLVRHDDRSFRRLCSSCVLLSHPAAFCSACLSLLSPQETATACSRCNRFAIHVTCLPAGPTSVFVCPSCAAAAQRRTFSYNNRSNNGAGGACRAVFDERAARVLLVAAQISYWSAARAAAEAHVEAERRAREAALARKRSRDALDAAVKAHEEAQREAALVRRRFSRDAALSSNNSVPVHRTTKGDRRGLFGTLQL